MEGVKTIITLLGDLATFFWLTLRPQSTLAAENLFLRKQLAMFQERKAKPHRPDTPNCNVTTNPTAVWTLQQLREAIPSDHGYRFLIHDRDGIFSPHLDQSISHMGLRVLRTPPRSPKANSLCERVIGTRRRECLDYFIPLTESHLRCIATNWLSHYNQGRPHSSIGPGIPDPPTDLPASPQIQRHRIPDHLKVVIHPILGGLHHEYSLLPKAA